MKDYYSILGLVRTATNGEIKASFRRLANLYHPDRNPSPEAESIIKDVIEAYQVLEDPIQRSLYDGLLKKDDPPPMMRDGRPHRDPRYRTRRPDPNYKSEKQQMLEFMNEWLPAARIISACTLALCFLMTADLVLPSKKEVQIIEVASQSLTYRGSFDGGEKIITQNGDEITLSRHAAARLRSGSSVTIFYSPFLKIPLSLVRSDSAEVFRIPATIYGNFIFLPMVLLITSLLGVFWLKGIGFRFNLGVVNAILVFLVIIFLLIQHLKSS